MTSVCASELQFDIHEIDHPFDVSDGKPQIVVLAGRLTGLDTEDLVIFGRFGRESHSALYSYKGSTYSRTKAIELPTDVTHIDTWDYVDGSALLILRAGRIERFDPSRGAFNPWVEINVPNTARTSSTRPVRSEIQSPFNSKNDVNGDGLDDILFVSNGATVVRTQRSDGSLAEPIVLSSIPDVEIRSRFYTEQPLSQVQWWNKLNIIRRLAVFPVDYDGDGVSDLAAVTRVDEFSSLAVHRGLEDSSWSAEPFIVPIEKLKAPRDRQILAVDDFDGDGVGDIAAFTFNEELESRYEFHFGYQREGQFMVRETAEAFIAPEGVLLLTELTDLDSDGDVDFCLVPLTTGIGTKVSAVLRRSVTLEFQCYQMTDTRYPVEPTKRWRTRMPIEVLGPDSLADLTGDGVLDVVVAPSKTRLDIHPGTGDASLFSRKAITIEMNLPEGEGTILFRDLNRDGKADMLVVPSEAGRPLWVALSR